jgi:hypothetical protein
MNGKPGPVGRGRPKRDDIGSSPRISSTQWPSDLFLLGRRDGIYRVLACHSALRPKTVPKRWMPRIIGAWTRDLGAHTRCRMPSFRSGNCGPVREGKGGNRLAQGFRGVAANWQQESQNCRSDRSFRLSFDVVLRQISVRVWATPQNRPINRVIMLFTTWGAVETCSTSGDPPGELADFLAFSLPLRL